MTLPAMNEETTKEEDVIPALLALMARLRDRENGCPWDLAQDFKSIAPHTIEEAYEVADAIDRGNMQDLKDELGDLLFQVVFHAQMAAERGAFDFHDVARHVTDKMVHRHPHVFGDEAAQTAGDVNEIWDERKAQEDKPEQESILDDVPRNLPAALRAQKLQKRAAGLGFEWKSTEDILTKLEEEIAELREAVKSGDKNDISSELGDLMFVAVSFARYNDLNGEEVLRNAGGKFYRRFSGIESDIKKENKDINAIAPEDFGALWQAQKEKERK